MGTRIHLARVELAEGDLGRATDHATRAEDLHDSLGESATDARLFCLQEWLRSSRGDLDAASERFARADAIVDDVVDPDVQAVVYRHLATFEDVHGDAEGASEHLERSRDLAASIDAEVAVPAVEAAVEAESSLSRSKD